MTEKLILYFVFALAGKSIWGSNPGLRIKSIDCDQTPQGVDTKNPVEGDGGFKLRIKGNPGSYAPEKKYTVVLENTAPLRKFTQFVFSAETLLPSSSDAGKFQLQDVNLSEFSKDCPNTILQTSNIPKNSIEVFWVAPGVDSGCVVLKAGVVDVSGVWYMQHGKLTLKLCQGELESTVQPEILEKCDACEEAGYELIFEPIWSRQTHPNHFPDDHFSTNFSTIIGASHSVDYRLWKFGEYASKGIANLAANGSVKELEKELKNKSSKIRTIIKAKALVHLHLKEKAFALFRTDNSHHLLSLISKFNPSPDWVVGVPALELCLKNGSWINSRIVNLYPIDLGIYDGITYEAEKIPTIPQGVIHSLSSSHPDSPFYNSDEISIPLAKIIINRQRLFQKPCRIQLDQFDACALTEWSPYSACSSSCGKGFQRRTRNFINKHKAYKRCTAQLDEERICYAPCTKNGAREQSQHKCETTEWSDWSTCSCGSAYSVRERNYIKPLSRKSCSEPLQDKQPCPPTSSCECKVTEWSEWSPCNATCGTGMKIRTRLYVSGAAPATCDIERVQFEKCIANMSKCDNQVSSEVCLEPKNSGPCRGYFQRWYFDSSRRMCMQFVYGGCRGNRNIFERYSDCNRVCESVLGAKRNDSLSQAVLSTKPTRNEIDCKTSWSAWSTCSQTCGKARKQRRRIIDVNPENGGKPCPNNLVQRRRCKGLPPCYQTYGKDNCLYLPWGEWSSCSQTCGTGIQIRKRKVAPTMETAAKSCRFQKDQMYCYREKCIYD